MLCRFISSRSGWANSSLPLSLRIAARPTVAYDQLLQQRFDVGVLQVSIGLDCQTITRRLVLACQTPQRLRVVVTIVDKVPGPHVVAAQRGLGTGNLDTLE